jgi:hypothetical protein
MVVSQRRPDTSRGPLGRTWRAGAALLLSTMLVSMLFTGPANAAPPAALSAATLTNISVTVTTTMCPQGGSVSKANVTIDTPGTSGVSSGDTVGGLQAYTGNNTAL